MKTIKNPICEDEYVVIQRNPLAILYKPTDEILCMRIPTDEEIEELSNDIVDVRIDGDNESWVIIYSIPVYKVKIVLGDKNEKD